jgi:hypothetical protein
MSCSVTLSGGNAGFGDRELGPHRQPPRPHDLLDLDGLDGPPRSGFPGRAAAEAAQGGDDPLRQIRGIPFLLSECPDARSHP